MSSTSRVDRYVSSIRLCSTILAPYDLPDVPDVPSTKPPRDQVLFSHLSTLLNTGNPLGQVVAVTGCTALSGPQATIVVSSDSSTKKAAMIMSKDVAFEISPCKPANLTIDKIINYELPPRHGVNILDHIPNLFAAIKHATTPIPNTSPVQYALRLRDFHIWIVSRCIVRIRHRFRTARQEWTFKPWDAMLNWSPSFEDVQKIEPSLIGVPELIQLLLRMHGLDLPLQDKTSFAFDGSTISTWVRCLANLLGHANSLLDYKNKQDDKNELTAQHLAGLAAILTAVDFLLQLKQIEDAFVATSLQYQFNPIFSYRPSKIPIGTHANRNNAANDGDLPDDEDLCKFHSARKQSKETDGEHVLRYLRTLTAWHTASVAVLSALRRTPVSNVSIVRLADRSAEAQDDVSRDRAAIFEQLVTRTLALSPTLEAHVIRDWLDKSFHIRHVRVHAEAGLMALAQCVNNPSAGTAATHELPSDLFEALSMAEVPAIGVSKKCCYLCYLLWKELYCVSDNIEPKFLPKTHGHIVPWDPPRFGISEDVLRRLADRLELEVIRLAKNQAEQMGNLSQQSSPQSDRSGSDTDTDDINHWDLDKEDVLPFDNMQ